MSSTVGYGIEIKGEIFSEPVEEGDWEFDLAKDFPEFAIARSRAEYGDEELVFVLLKSTVVEAGKSYSSQEDGRTATSFTPVTPEDNPFENFINASGVTVARPAGWHLVDYYVYS